MRGRVIWRRLAEEDLTKAYLFLGADSPAAAESLVDAIESATRFLLANPGVGRLREFESPFALGVRSWAVPKFEAYLLFYAVRGDGLEIVRLLHGARDLDTLFGREP